MFEKASPQKLRFSTPKGMLTTEDLWDLSLQQLNVVAKDLNKKIKSSQEEDFLDEPTAEDTNSKLQFDIVKHIMDIKKETQRKAVEASAKKAQRDRILELISKKKDNELERLSVEELTSKLNEYL